MKNITRHKGKLETIRREASSRYGNPRFLLQVAGFTCYTAPDSDLGYEVGNYEGKQVIATMGLHYGRVTLISVELAQSQIDKLES